MIVTSSPASPVTMPSHDLLRRVYRLILTMRHVHERATNLQRQGRIHSWLGCLGQEAAILGTAAALEAQDWVFPTYREHPVPLYRGVPLKALFDHIFANGADNVIGRNLPPEYSFREVNFVCSSAPLGNQIPQAVGAAWAAKLRRDPVVTMAYFGDGTSSQGDFHVAMNFAAVYRTPTVFVCQNNGWAISTPTRVQTVSGSFAEKALAYGFDGVQVDGNDFVETYQAARAAVEKARAGGGPTLIECLTYRVGPHSTSDDPSQYRDPAEVEVWRERDPLLVLERRMREAGAWDDSWATDAQEQTRLEVLEASEAAEHEAQPALETMFTDVYATMPWHLVEQVEEARGS
jgi:pyruvate dehydrogenase E1 component alpha subunit